MIKALGLLLTHAFVVSMASGAEKLQDIHGATVIAAGEIQRYPCPGLGIYDCTGWPAALYKFSEQGICFTLTESCDVDCQAVLLERGGEQALLLFGGRYREPIRKSSGRLENCP